jgi:non-heme chloroperoxidase
VDLRRADLGVPLFQAATANLNPWTEAKVDTHNPERGPLLFISGERDHTVPWAMANASYQQQEHNPGVTEIVEMKGRGHALTIDQGLTRGRRHRPRLRQTLHFVRG